MDMNIIFSYISDYGLLFIGIIIFLEYLNLPGFPAGIILPLAGAWASTNAIGIISTLVVSIVAALIASWVLYIVGWFGGELLIKKYVSRFPKQKETIEKQLAYLRKKGNIGIFISKLIPMVRTLISIPAGTLKLNFIQYSIFSALGIAVWNSVFMFGGYLLAEQFINQI